MAEERLKFEHLPQSVLPIVYDVTIDSNLEALTFKGKVEIDCDVIEVSYFNEKRKVETFGPARH